MSEQQYDFVGEEKKTGMAAAMHFIWNSEKKEFCGRNGASWAKVSFFYSIFYACLGAFFIGMLSVFFQIMPLDKPTYYGYESTMHQKGLNPGLGFRPQIDVEDSLIYYNPLRLESEYGFKTYFENLKIFLEDKYAAPEDSENVVQCVDGQTDESVASGAKSCEFDYKKIFETTNCTEQNHFGYQTNKPCVLVKLNKIVSWKPEFDSDDETNIIVKCEGQTSVDKDNLKNVVYHSENNLNNAEAGYINKKYFPFFAQKSYRAPFIFVQFDLDSNILVRVRCRAFAGNIDNEDDMNLRGQTKFSIQVKG